MRTPFFALILGLSIIPFTSQAAANFKTGPVYGHLQSEEIQVTKAQALLSCRFEDSSGANASTTTRPLRTQLSVMGHHPQLGYLYALAIEKGELSTFRIFTDLRSCSYQLELSGYLVKTKQETHGKIVLAGSTFDMPNGELVTLLRDPLLGSKISEKIKSLHIGFNPRSNSIEALNLN